MLNFSLILLRNICCGYSLQSPWWGSSDKYSQCNVLEEKLEIPWMSFVFIIYSLNLEVSLVSGKAIIWSWPWENVSLGIGGQKAQIRLHICAVWSGPLLSAYINFGHCSMYQWRENAWVRLKRYESESVHFAHVQRHLLAWHGPWILFFCSPKFYAFKFSCKWM